jgi:hypothetical protein
MRRLLLSLIIPSALGAQAGADSIVRAALSAIGGEARVARARVLEWSAIASVHAGGQTVDIRGRWRVNPPDSAISTTWLAARGESTARSLALAGPRGWMSRDTLLLPMASAVLAEERHQFYLYSLLRIAPLLEPGVKLTRTGLDPDGHPGVLVEREGRLPVTLYFDRNGGMVFRMLTRFATESGPGDTQDIRLTNFIESDGFRWFKRMEIHRAGKPYFEMELTSLRTASSLSDPLLSGRRSP